MCVMVLSTLGKLKSILEKLNNIDISQVYFFNVDGGAKLGVPCISLMPFINLLVCEESMFGMEGFREGVLLHEAKRLSVPVISETGLEAIIHD